MSPSRPLSPSRPRLAIVGAGPIGLDAALAALDLGLPFTLYESGERAASSVRDWAHVRLFSPWSMDVSPRMRRHLADAGIEAPDGDGCPTGGELLERVLDPVAALPGVAARTQLGCRVVAVSREGLVKSDEIGTGRRAGRPFRALVEQGGRERVETADAVLDCSGTWSHPNALGDGGIPAPGERELDGEIVRRIPDVEREADAWAGRTTLLVGAGHSAQTAARDLADLADRRPGTRVLWALRGDDSALASGERDTPLDGATEGDPLPERGRLVSEAAALARGGSPRVEALRGVVVEALRRESGRIEVVLRHRDGSVEPRRVDRIVSLTGAVGDPTLYRQLQVHECYATSGPMKLAASLLAASAESGGDCLAQPTAGTETLVNPEPGFFVLGAKSYGRTATFLLRTGWEQVDAVMGLVTGSRAA